MYEDAIVTSKSDIAERKESYEKEIEERKTIYNEKLSKAKTLIDSAEPNGDFALLKYYNGLEYEKIIGIYIIHNRENDKYYVGQSKDVLKRLKQHFNGTVPRNIIFAEDYYHSHFENLEDLFEVQIIRCETKDELDALERELIYKYDSCNNGYNSTKGNI